MPLLPTWKAWNDDGHPNNGACQLQWLWLGELITSEVLIRRQRALEPMPPAFWLHPTTPEENRYGQVTHDAAPIIKPQSIECVGHHTTRHETLVIVPEQWALELAASSRVPVQRHEEGQISRPDIQVPELPINQKGRPLARAGEQEVPGVRVTVGDGQCAAVDEAQPRLE